jgi:hypothetical protein
MAARLQWVVVALVAASVTIASVSSLEEDWVNQAEREGLVNSSPQSAAERNTLLREKKDLLRVLQRPLQKLAEIDHVLQSRKSPTLGERMKLEDRPGEEALRMVMAPQGPNYETPQENNRRLANKAAGALGSSSDDSQPPGANIKNEVQTAIRSEPVRDAIPARWKADYSRGYKAGSDCQRHVYSTKSSRDMKELFKSTGYDLGTAEVEDSSDIEEGSPVLKESWGQTKEVVHKDRVKKKGGAPDQVKQKPNNSRNCKGQSCEVEGQYQSFQTPGLQGVYNKVPSILSSLTPARIRQWSSCVSHR